MEDLSLAMGIMHVRLALSAQPACHFQGCFSICSGSVQKHSRIKVKGQRSRELGALRWPMALTYTRAPPFLVKGNRWAWRSV